MSEREKDLQVAKRN